MEHQTKGTYWLDNSASDSFLTKKFKRFKQEKKRQSITELTK